MHGKQHFEDGVFANNPILKFRGSFMLDLKLLESLGNHWSKEESAVSFYFSEASPTNRAHNAARITAKELARNVIRTNQSPELRNIVERLERCADQLRVEQMAGLAIFADPPNLWTEVELSFAVTPQSFVGKSFMLAPLSPALTTEYTYFILLLDRSVSRLFVVKSIGMTNQIKELEQNRQKVRETGTSRKSSDERSKDDDAYHHLRHVGERMLKLINRNAVESVYIGCRNELRAEIEAAMPDDLVRKIADYFPCDPSLVSAPEVAELVAPAIQKREHERLKEVFADVLGECARNGKGAVGPRKVIKSLERGEIQTLVIAPHPSAPASVCTSCEHIDIGGRATCSLCGKPARLFQDLSEVLVRRASKGAFDLLLAPENEPIGQANGFLAKLRFRADRSRAEVA
jgi:Bacterial archaeo-eukaryotic release factor family 10